MDRQTKRHRGEGTDGQVDSQTDRAKQADGRRDHQAHIFEFLTTSLHRS